MIAKKVITSIAAVAILMSISMTANAQTTRTTEIGVKANNLGSFSFLYKLQRKENKFLRISPGMSIYAGLYDPGQNLRIGTSFDLGFERRVDLNDKFQFLHGFMPGVGLAYSFDDQAPFDTDYLAANVRLGYILGFQYNFAKTFFIGVEAVPSVSIGSPDIVDANKLFLNAGFSPNVGITFVYQFEKPKK